MRHHYIKVALWLTAALALASCDEDVLEAERISGEYKGDFGMYYEYTRGGRTYAFDADYSYLQLQNYAFSSKGNGVQIDYYSDGPYREIWHQIRWRVNSDRARGQYITFHYLWEREWDTNIYDYLLTDDVFKGYFEDSSQRFMLLRLTPPSGWSWDPYYRKDYGCYNNSGWRDGYFDYDGYYYRAPAKDAKTAAPQPSELRFGNRYTEKKP